MQNQKGFSMIEVLMTILIVSFGLLGIASIIVNSIKSNQSSYARTQASVLSNDIIDRMRANRTTAEAIGVPYNLAMNDATPTASTIPTTDLNQWRTALAATLPSGKGAVNVDSTTKKVTVVVQWNNSRVIDGAASQQVSVETRL